MNIILNIVFLKKFIKKTVPNLPGYKSFIKVLRRFRKNGNVLDRLPVKPGLIIKVFYGLGVFYMARPERCSIAKRYFWTSGITEIKQDQIALDVFVKLSKISDFALDIGSNSGLFTLVAMNSNPRLKVLAFDILPEAYHVMVDNLILNNVLDRVEMNLVGVGVKDGFFDVPFNQVSSEMPTSLSLNYHDNDPPPGVKLDVIAVENSRSVSIPIKSLDSICIPRFLGKKICIKIDVEGTEVDIFNNSLETLKLIRPDIICEVLVGAKDVSIYDAVLTKYGYLKYLITADGLLFQNSIVPNPTFKDWFFTVTDSFKLNDD